MFLRCRRTLPQCSSCLPSRTTRLVGVKFTVRPSLCLCRGDPPGRCRSRGCRRARSSVRNARCSALFTAKRPRDDGGTIGGDRHGPVLDAARSGDDRNRGSRATPHGCRSSGGAACRSESPGCGRSDQRLPAQRKAARRADCAAACGGDRRGAERRGSTGSCAE